MQVITVILSIVSSNIVQCLQIRYGTHANIFKKSELHETHLNIKQICKKSFLSNTYKTILFSKNVIENKEIKNPAFLKPTNIKKI